MKEVLDCQVKSFFRRRPYEKQACPQKLPHVAPLEISYASTYVSVQPSPVNCPFSDECCDYSATDVGAVAPSVIHGSNYDTV